jgi:dolichol kinase
MGFLEGTLRTRMTSDLAIEITVVVVWLVSLSLFQGLLQRMVVRQSMAAFTARKIAHLAVGFWILPLAFWVPRWYLAGIPVTVILAANMKANLFRASLGRTARQFFPVVTCAAPVALILIFWSHQHIDLVVLAVLAMTVGDTAAALVGRRIGRVKLSWNGKTVEGGAANFVASLVTLSVAGRLLYQMPVGRFVLPAAAAAILEAILPGEWDNPVTLMLVLILLRYQPLS